MLSAGPLRWLLTLVALVSPFAATICGASDGNARQPDADTHVVYRHYL